MQDAIILYENGKAIGGEGHPTNASDITFDNTGTDLVSEEVESAIKEVNGKFDKGSVSVTPNGVKTLGALLNELASLMDTSKLTKDSVLKIGHYYLPMINNEGTDIYFTTTYAYGTSPYIAVQTAMLKSGASTFWVYNGSSASSSVNTVIAVGTVIALYY